MTYSDPDLDDLDDDETDPNEEPLVKKLRGLNRDQKKQIKDLQKQVGQNQEATKKLAFIEAKLPDNPQVQFFLDHYEGDYDPAVIRTKAAEYGFIAPESQEQQQELGAVEQMMQANQGGQQMAAPGSDAELEALINAVPPGPNASARIRDLMIRAGRYIQDE